MILDCPLGAPPSRASMEAATNTVWHIRQYIENRKTGKFTDEADIVSEWTGAQY